jgi:uncharacterized Tic20 family protein
MNDVNEREDQLVAGLCHASVLIPLIGISVPLAIWFSQRERSPLLRFQALQALVYQLVGLLGGFLLYACQMLGGVGIFPFSIIMAGIGEAVSPRMGSGQEIAPLFGIVIILSFLLIGLISMVVMFSQCILGPLYVLLGLWAAGRVLAGRPFHYPILGRWLERRRPANPQGSTTEVSHATT